MAASTAMQSNDFKAFVSRALKQANPQFKDQLTAEVKVLAKRLYNNDPSLTSRNWSTVDPINEFQTLRQQAALTSFVPPPPAAGGANYGYLGPPGAGTGAGGGGSYAQAAGGTGRGMGPGQGRVNVFDHEDEFVPLNNGAGAGAGGSKNLGKRKKGPHAHSNGNANPIEIPLGDHHTLTQSSKPHHKKQKLSSSMFTSPTTMSTSYETEAERIAKEKRAMRFEREREIEKRREMGLIDDDGGQDGGMVPRQVVGLGVGVGGGMGRKGKGLMGRIEGFGGVGMEPEADPNVINWDKYTIKGTSTKVEKSYLRLTSEPDPSTIRPLPVLQEAFTHLKRKWREEKGGNYPWVCDQFKSMRQDLTVQRIKNDFTVKVYEQHARFAMEANDLGEYNQCQSMLKQLYEHGIPGCAAEFLGYRILYMLHTRNSSELGRTIAGISPAEKREEAVSHALAVHTAVTTGNYHRFFKLYEDAPNMSGYIMDHFVERERVAALQKISKSYMSISLNYLAKELGHVSGPDLEPLKMHEFLVTHQADVYSSPADLKTLSAAIHNAKRYPNNIIDSAKFEGIMWDCKKNADAIEQGAAKYRTIDIKGQV